MFIDQNSIPPNVAVQAPAERVSPSTARAARRTVACNRVLAGLLSERPDKDDRPNSALKLALRRDEIRKTPSPSISTVIKAHESAENVTGARPE